MPESELIGGRYRLGSELDFGRGRLARDTVLDRTVTLTRVPGPDDPVAVERASREVRIAMRLSHPGVVSVLDVLVEDGVLHVVTEAVSGARSLNEVLNEARWLDSRRVAEIGVEIVGALEAAHRLGVVHGGLGPGGVLIGEDGRVRVAGFGIATAYGTVGNPRNLSPEIISGEPRHPADDLWALGVILFEAVEGHHPFERSGGVTVTLHRIVQGDLGGFERASRDLRRVIRTLLVPGRDVRPDAPRAAELLRWTVRDRSATNPFSGPATAPFPDLAQRQAYAPPTSERSPDLSAPIGPEPSTRQPGPAPSPDLSPPPPPPAPQASAAPGSAGGAVMRPKPRARPAGPRARPAPPGAALGQGTGRLVSRTRPADPAKGRRLLAEGRYAEAEEALRAVMHDPGPHPVELFADYAAALRGAGRGGEARMLLVRTLDRDKGGRVRADLAALTQELEQSQVDELAAVAEEAERTGRPAAEQVDRRSNLAVALRDDGRLEEAEEQARRAVATAERELGRRHPAKARALANLGVIRLERDAAGEAVEVLVRALRIARRALGRKHPEALTIQASVAAARQRAGDLDEAAKLLEDVARRRSKVLGETHPATLNARASLGFVAIERGAADDAERMFAAVLEAGSELADNDAVLVRAADGLSQARELMRTRGEAA